MGDDEKGTDHKQGNLGVRACVCGVCGGGGGGEPEWKLRHMNT